MTNGQFIRQRLVEAGSKGVVIADLHKERKANWKELGITYKTGTYHSFARLFYFLEQLGWVETTGKTEEAFAKGTTSVLLATRTYYRITDEGLAHPEIDWTDPLAAKYPELTGSKRASMYRLPTGKPIGRPRIGAPKIEKPPKPPKVKKPVVKKVPEVVLTEEDKRRVIEEFRDIMKREPTKAEIYELFLEDLKLKRRRAIEEKG